MKEPNLADDINNIATFAYGAYKASGIEAFFIIYNNLINIVGDLLNKDLPIDEQKEISKWPS